MKPTHAQVHRFGSSVACWLGNGETRYLTARDARKLAKALNAAAREIQTQPDFTKSTIGTASFEFPDGRKADFEASEERQAKAQARGDVKGFANLP